MHGHRPWVIAANVFLLLTAADEAAELAGKGNPQTFAALEREARSFFLLWLEREDGKSRTELSTESLLEWMSNDLKIRTFRITQDKDVRSALETLIRCVDLSPRDHSDAWITQREFVAVAATVCASLDNIEHRLKDHVFGEQYEGNINSVDLRYPSWPNAARWEGVVLAAIESYRDERAQEFLMHYALKKPEGGKIHPMSERALLFLRGFDPTKIKPRIEAALKEELKKGEVPKPPPPPGRRWRWHSRAAYLRNCLNSLEYASSLPPQERDAYDYFERSRWWSHAFARQHTATIADWGVPDWREGNERFLLALMKMDPTGEFLEYRQLWPLKIPPKGLAWLKQQAESRDLPATVKEELAEIIRIQTQDKAPKRDKEVRKKRGKGDKSNY